MKTRYERPGIHKVHTDTIHPISSYSGSGPNLRTHIDTASIESLANTFGSPLFVFSEKQMRTSFDTISNAFSSYYPKVTFGWSYKTNYLSAICSVFHQKGALAEVVSKMEYDKARNLGVDGKNIIFNGPGKSKDALEKAVMEGARIHIDHIDEMCTLESIAKTIGRKIKVGLRVNMDTGIQPQWSRFGLNLESGQALAAIERMARKKRLILNGLHTHIGTYILLPDAYYQATQKLLKLARIAKQRFGFHLDYLDLGGGFPSNSRLKGSYYSPQISVPPIDDYAKKISQALYTFADPDQLPELILESGRAMIDEAGFLISTIQATKRMPDGRRAYIADAGINLLYTSTWYKHQVELNQTFAGQCEPSILFGPLCMNIDIIEESIPLPPLSKGAHLILSPVGAYNVTQWMQFITYRPAVVLLGKNGETDLIREREDLSDINRREILPKRMISTPNLEHIEKPKRLAV